MESPVANPRHCTCKAAPAMASAIHGRVCGKWVFLFFLLPPSLSCLGLVCWLSSSFLFFLSPFPPGIWRSSRLAPLSWLALDASVGASLWRSLQASCNVRVSSSFSFLLSSSLLLFFSFPSFPPLVEQKARIQPRVRLPTLCDGCSRDEFCTSARKHLREVVHRIVGVTLVQYLPVLCTQGALLGFARQPRGSARRGVTLPS